MAEFMRRFATGLDQYEFAEVRSDNAADFEEAVAFMQDHVGGGGATAKAVDTVKKSFGNTTEVKKSGGFGNNRGQQAQGSTDARELGEHDGYKITARSGKFGPYFNAYQKGADPERINANLPKGMSLEQATLQDAIDTLSAA